MLVAEIIRPLLREMEALDVGVVCASADGRTVYANPRIERQVGAVPPGVPASEWAARFGLARPDGAAYERAGEIPLLKALDAGEISSHMLSRDRGRGVLLETLTAPVIDASGGCIGSVGIFRATRSVSWRPMPPSSPYDAQRRTLGEIAQIPLFLAALELSGRFQRTFEPLHEQALRLARQRHAEDWTLPRFADELSVSPRYLTSVVARHTGDGLMHQLASIRTLEAQRLLVTTTATVASIGSKVGLHDCQRFVRTFRRHSGCTPSEYRAKYGVSAAQG